MDGIVNRQHVNAKMPFRQPLANTGQNQAFRLVDQPRRQHPGQRLVTEKRGELPLPRRWLLVREHTGAATAPVEPSSTTAAVDGALRSTSKKREKMPSPLPPSPCQTATVRP